MSTSENLRLTKALKKDQVYNWFDRYETNPKSGSYIINRNLGKQPGNAGRPAAMKLKRVKVKFKAAVETTVQATQIFAN